MDNLTMGVGSYGTPLVLSWDIDRKVKVGNFCSIADGVVFLVAGDHRVDWVTTSPLYCVPGHPASKGDIVVGNDVWIGYGATIMSGVTIGDGAVVGARSVVTKDVPPFAIVAGNPARVVRHRFDDATIARLREIAWWDWPYERVMKHATLLCAPPEEFLRQMNG